MRQIGTRTESQPSRLPTAEALRLAAIHQKTGGALAALATTGVAKGVYRFRSHEEKNRHDDEALARVIAANAKLRASPGRAGQ